MLEVADVSKSYGEVHAVRGISLEVNPGEVVGLVGANGAGKTTTMNMIAGLLSPDRGTIRINGADVRTEPDRARPQLGYAPQATGIYPLTTVRENLEFFGRLEGMRRGVARDRANQLIDRLELAEYADRPTMTLSGGERRRTHIATAMMHSPATLILDEPTVGMDVHGRARLLELVSEIAHQDGVAVCFSSHYMPEVETVCDRVVIVHEGQVIAAGQIDELVSAHAASHVELTFADGHTETRKLEDVKAELPQLMADLAEDLGGLRSVDLMQASLETAFLALTGVRSEKEVDA